MSTLSTQMGAVGPSRPTTKSGFEQALESGGCIRQYEVIRELGRGGMGVVYAARDTRLGRRVAIKVLHDTTKRDVAERFLVEARATAQCNHENIVVIHEVEEHDGLPYMVLELLEGRTLRDVIEDEAPLPAARAMELALPVARALVRAHEAGIIHRDLKPENVFVTRSGQVKVLDFGIAKALGSRERGASVPSTNDDGDTDGFAGTPPYMSPEQMGVEEVDHRTDLWSLGIILFELLAGHHPIQPPTMQELINNAASDDPMPSIGAAVPGLPAGLVQLVDACLRKPKTERVPNAAVLAGSLEQLVRGGRARAEQFAPYPGLVAFQEADADRFFGRSLAIKHMVTRIHERPLTGVIGPSGAGKSSFVRAGVGPALKRVGRWEVVAFRPGRHPMTALAEVALRLAGSRQSSTAERQKVRQRIVEEPGYFGALLRKRARTSDGRVLLFVDQFEELYTLTKEREKRSLFLAALAGVADYASEPLRVTVSMRSDFLDRVAEDPRFVDELSGGLMFLGPPDREELREALVSPLELAGYRFESTDMVDAMVDALAGTPGALPLLQFTAAKLWDARDEARRVLSAASFEAIGGISGALASHADQVIAGMDSRARDLARRLFRSLVTPERTRAIIERADLEHLGADRTELDRVIDKLVAARLLVVQTRDDGDASIEIVHESLIVRWPMLRRWLDEDQQDAAFVAQVAAAAKPWDAQQRPHGLLWRGDVIEDAMRRDRARPQRLGGREREFLDAGFALARRSKRTRRIAVVATLAILGAVAVVSSTFYVRAEIAKEQAVKSEATAKLRLEQLEQEQRKRAAADEAKVAAEAGLVTADASKRAELAKAEADKRAELAKAEADKLAALGKQADTVKQALGEKLAAEIAAARNATTADERQRALDRLADELRKQKQDADRLNDELRTQKQAADTARAAADQAKGKLDQANAKLKAQLDAATTRQAALENEIKNLKLSTTLKGLNKKD